MSERAEKTVRWGIPLLMVVLGLTPWVVQADFGKAQGGGGGGASDLATVLGEGNPTGS